MTKAELKQAYLESRDWYVGPYGQTNEYALRLDTMLSNYFRLPLASFAEDDEDCVDQ